MRSASLCCAVVLLGGVASAGEPVLPAPRPVPTEIAWPISYERPNPYDVWQYLDVDRSGHFRPVVGPTYGSVHYLATGQPFPYWQSYPQWVKPTMANRANFGGPPEPMIFIRPAPTWDRMPYADE